MADPRFRNRGMQPWKVHGDEREYLYRANAECKWTRRGNTLSPASRQDQYCSSLLELPGRKEGVKEKERDPLLNHQLSPLHCHNGVSQVSFTEVAVYGLRGPSKSAVSRIRGFDLIWPSHQHTAGPQLLNVTQFTTRHIFTLVEAFPKSPF